MSIEIPDYSKLTLAELVVLRANAARIVADINTLFNYHASPKRSHKKAADSTASSPGSKRRSTLLGKKIAPKYRGAGGETWAGRGAVPPWLRGEDNKPLTEYLIRQDGVTDFERNRCRVIPIEGGSLG